MIQRAVSRGSLPCVWMSAGILSHKICDGDFQCDGCHLDAELRSGVSVDSHHDESCTQRYNVGVFPEDRLYGDGHSWIQAVEPRANGRYRLGLDAYAAAIVGYCVGIQWDSVPHTFSRGQTICQIDLGLGVLSIRAPLSGELVRGNRWLQDEPARLVAAPYEDGWLLEFKALDEGELDGLMTVEEAKDKSQRDLRRFRRRIAAQLLVNGNSLGATMQDGGEPVTDLREMLGGSAYLDLVRELIH